MRSNRAIFALFAPVLTLSLGACGDGTSRTGNAAATRDTPGARDLKEVLSKANGLDTISDLAKNSGLDAVLAGVGPYTIFAPTDDAFNALGKDRVAALKDSMMKAQDASLLTAHIVPGLLTTDDIRSAIKTGNGKAIMTTMDNGTLTFTENGDQIMVNADNGTKAAFSGTQMLASNGAIHPLTGVLVPTDTGVTSGSH